MRKNIIGAVFVTSLAFAAGASAQNVPEQFVVSGDAAVRLKEFNQINMATARALVDSCISFAQQNGRALSVYVIDQFGNHVAMQRMDGQGWINIRTAEMKARTALQMRVPSHARMNQARENPFNELYQITAHGLFPNSGGLPIIVNDQLIGAIGVGGAAPDENFSDEICAHHALTEVIGPQPPLLAVAAPRDPFTGERQWCRGGAGPDPAVGGTCN
jgi:glc operon protein GlcG